MDLCFVASDAPAAQDALAQAVALHGQSPSPDAVVAIGGDGFMLGALHSQLRSPRPRPVFGLHSGTVGFLMNSRGPSLESLPARVAAAAQVALVPLRATVETADDGTVEVLALNEIALRRATGQSAHLRVLVDGVERIADLSGDGALLSTPAGSAAYNASCGGPVLPLRSRVLALTGIAVGRPRRWPGAVLHSRSTVRFEVLQPAKRPVALDTDGTPQGLVLAVEAQAAHDRPVAVLFDADHDLDERLLAAQFG